MGLIFIVPELEILLCRKLMKLCHLSFLRVGGEGYENEKNVSCCKLVHFKGRLLWKLKAIKSDQPWKYKGQKMIE